MLLALMSGLKRQYEECERIFGDQKFHLIEELSDDTPPIFKQIKMSDFNELFTLYPPLPEIFPDAVLNSLAASLVDTLYASPRKYPHRSEWTDDSCNGFCNHDNITVASFDSDYLDDKDDNKNTTNEDDHDPYEYLEDKDDLDDEDDLMKPAPVTASKPASEVMIAELKEQCIIMINDKLAAFLASLRDCHKYFYQLS